MATKHTSRNSNVNETITFTEDEVIAALAKAYNLPMKGPDQYDCEVDISSSGTLRSIKFTRTVSELPLVQSVEI
jgi:hypothetical protein